MSRLVPVSLMILALGLAGCGNKQPFLGTWKSPSGGTVTFSEDGAFIDAVGNSTHRLTWKPHGDHVIEAVGPNGEKAEGDGGRTRWWVSSDGRTLTLTVPPDSQRPEDTTTYTRQ